MYLSRKVYVSGFGYSTAHWSSSDYRTTLCGRKYAGFHVSPDEARMCGNCARIMKKDISVAHVYALADNRNWDLDRRAAEQSRAEAEQRELTATDETPKLKAGVHMESELFPGCVIELMHRTTEVPVSWSVKFRDHSVLEYIGTQLELPASVLVSYFNVLMEAPEPGARYRMVYGTRVGREIVLQRKSTVTDFHNRVAGFDPESYWHYEEVAGTVIDEDDQMPVGNISTNALRRLYERLV